MEKGANLSNYNLPLHDKIDMLTRYCVCDSFVEETEVWFCDNYNFVSLQ